MHCIVRTPFFLLWITRYRRQRLHYIHVIAVVHCRRRPLYTRWRRRVRFAVVLLPCDTSTGRLHPCVTATHTCEGPLARNSVLLNLHLQRWPLRTRLRTRLRACTRTRLWLRCRLLLMLLMTFCSITVTVTVTVLVDMPKACRDGRRQRHWRSRCCCCRCHCCCTSYHCNRRCPFFLFGRIIALWHLQLRPRRQCRRHQSGP